MPTEQAEKSDKSPVFRWGAASVLFGGFLCHLSLGSAYTFGNFTPYIISYIRNRTDDTEANNVDATWNLIVGGVGNTVGLAGGGILDMRFGPRIATLVGAILFSGSIMLTSLTVRISFFWYIFTNGFLYVFGETCGYGPPIQTAIKWYPKRPTLAAGIVLSGYGGGALIFNQVLTAYINPDNLTPDLIDDDNERYFTQPELLDRVPWSFVLLGGIYFLLLVIGIAFLRSPPIQTLTEKDETNSPSKCATEEAIPVEAKIDGSDLSALQVLKTALTSRNSYILWFSMYGTAVGMIPFALFYKAYAQTFIFDDHFLAVVGSLSSVFNCIGRPVWGLVMDRFGFRVTLRLISFGLAMFAGTIIFTENWNKIFFLLWICMMFFIYCGIWAIVPSALAKLYGVRHMSINYSIVISSVSLAGITSSVSALTLKASIGWHGLFFIATSLAAAPFLTSFLFNGKDRNGKEV